MELHTIGIDLGKTVFHLIESSTPRRKIRGQAPTECVPTRPDNPGLLEHVFHLRSVEPVQIEQPAERIRENRTCEGITTSLAVCGQSFCELRNYWNGSPRHFRFRITNKALFFVLWFGTGSHLPQRESRKC